MSPTLNEVRRQSTRLLTLHVNVSKSTFTQASFLPPPCPARRPASRPQWGATVQSQGKNPPVYHATKAGLPCNAAHPHVQRIGQPAARHRGAKCPPVQHALCARLIAVPNAGTPVLQQVTLAEVEHKHMQQCIATIWSCLRPAQMGLKRSSPGISRVRWLQLSSSCLVARTSAAT